MSALPNTWICNEQSKSTDELSPDIGFLETSWKPVNSIPSFSVDKNGPIHMLRPLHEDVLTSEQL